MNLIYFWRDFTTRVDDVDVRCERKGFAVKKCSIKYFKRIKFQELNLQFTFLFLDKNLLKHKRDFETRLSFIV